MPPFQQKRDTNPMRPGCGFHGYALSCRTMRTSGHVASEIYEAFANESMACDEPWPKKGAYRSSSD